MDNKSNNKDSHQLVDNNSGEVRRCIPVGLLACAKLPRAQKMAIFADRKRKILEFLVNENYSGIKNLASLINTSRQTVMRIMKSLCDDQYATKFEMNLGFANNLSIYQITNTGIMLILDEAILNLPKPPKIDSLRITRDFRLQEIRISLQKRGYTNFQKLNQLCQTKHKLCNKNYKVPKYLCLDVDGHKVAIEYEEIIQNNDNYQLIIKQYINAVQDGLIDKILFFTRTGFADKLNKLFFAIGKSMFKNDITASNLSKIFRFLEEV